MLLNIIKKELLDNTISLRFLVLIFLTITLIPLSLYVNFRKYETRVSDYNQAVRLHHEEWIQRDFMELFNQRFAVKGYRKPKPLSVFINGLETHMPSGFKVDTGGMIFENTNSLEETKLSLLGNLDFLFIIQIIYSLLAILFTFDAISGEKESGTLRLSLSNSAPRYYHIFGKYIASMLLLIIPLLIALLAGIIMLIALGFPLIEIEMVYRLMLMSITASMIISVFICLGLFISSRSKSSKTSIVILISLWVILILIIPQSSEILAKIVKPVRSQEVFRLEKMMLRRNSDITKGHELYELRQKQDIEREKLEQGSDKNDTVFKKHLSQINTLRAEHVAKLKSVLNAIENDYQNEKQQQYSIANILASLSPLTPFNNIMNNLSVTGSEARETFEIAAKSYQKMLDKELFDKIHRDIMPDGSVNLGIGGKVDHKSIPQFQDTAPTLKQTLRTITLDSLLLALYMILTFAFAYVSFLRYDVR